MAKFTPRPGLDELVARMIVGDVNKIIEATAATARRLAPPTKQWISVMDGRERHSHNLAHGKTIPDNLRFTLKAFQWDVQHPNLGGVKGSIRRGDGTGYDGPPAEYAGSSSYLLKPRDRSGEHFVQIVNCFPGDTRVSAAEVRGSFRRWYRGDLIRVETEGGRVLTGTPNHEVLTDRGWVTLGALDEGSKVVCQRRSGRGPLGAGGEVDPHVDDLPPRIDEVARALTVAGHRQRIAGVPMDFHGDGRVGQVDVVRPERLLHFGEVTAFRKQARQLDLSPAQPLVVPRLPRMRAADTGLLLVRRAAALLLRGGRKSAAFFRGRARHADLHGCATTPDSHATLAEAVVDRGPGHGVLGGQRLDGLAGEIALSDFVHGEILAARAVDPVFLSDDAHGVVLDSVRVAERFDWQGYVYNLETLPQWYIANGIVAHNCRCVIKRDPQGIARMVGVDLAHAVGTRVSGMVYAEGPGVLAAEHGDEYPLPSGPRRERGTKFMARTVAKMGGL